MIDECNRPNVWPKKFIVKSAQGPVDAMRQCPLQINERYDGCIVIEMRAKPRFYPPSQWEVTCEGMQVS